MKKRLLAWSFAVVALYTPYLFAEWEPVAVSNNGSMTYYIDKEALRKNGGFVYFWILVDYLEPRNESLSTKDYYKAICATNMMSLQSIQYFEVPMAKGEPASVSVFDRGGQDSWIEIEKDSMGGIALDAVCN